MSTPAIMNLIDPVIVVLGYHTSFPNQIFDVTDETQPEYLANEYIKVSYLEARSETNNYATDRVPSILQIDRCVKSGSGNRDSIIQDVLDAFPKNLKLTSSGANVRVDRAPTIGSSFNVKGWHITPISIPYEVYR